MVGRWIKENELANALSEPNDDDFIINELKDFLDSYKNLGESCARGMMHSKLIKVKNAYCVLCRGKSKVHFHRTRDQSNVEDSLIVMIILHGI